jgi:hypothetical protein
MIKKIMVLVLALGVHEPYSVSVEPHEHITLESGIIKIIDNMPLGITKETIGAMLQIRREIKKMQYGVLNSDGVLVGIYTFQGHPYSISQLAEYESHFEDAYDPALYPVLEQAKQDFVKKIMSFLEIARGAKKYITRLIDESCKKRGRAESELRRWGAAKEGHEEKQFREDIKNFTIFHGFCTDLVNFLEDLMHSCPKALAEFREYLAHAKTE